MRAHARTDKPDLRLTPRASAFCIPPPQRASQLLPELQPAADLYWRTDAAQGNELLPYVFLDEILGTYIEVLLWLPGSPRCDELLLRAFGAVEAMLASSDEKVRELAVDGFLEKDVPGTTYADGPIP